MDWLGRGCKIWPPTFLLIGLYHKLLRPSNEDAMGDARRLVNQAQHAGREMMDKAQQATGSVTGQTTMGRTTTGV
jgi:hypothetical protein